MIGLPFFWGKTVGSEPLKVTFSRDLFFSGFKGQDKTARMVKAYVFGTTAESLVPYRRFIAVLAFHLLHHGTFLLSSIF
jgi:hypothetical protein